MKDNTSFDLGAGDISAVQVEHVLDTYTFSSVPVLHEATNLGPANDIQITLLIHTAYITRLEPTVLCEHQGSLLGIIAVRGHTCRGFVPDFAWLSTFDRLVLPIGYHCLDIRQQISHCICKRGVLVVRGETTDS